jgi:hypothetical protein
MQIKVIDFGKQFFNSKMDKYGGKKEQEQNEAKVNQG